MERVLTRCARHRAERFPRAVGCDRAQIVDEEGETPGGQMICLRSHSCSGERAELEFKRLSQEGAMLGVRPKGA